ncbi:MAG: hypothetical protein ABSF90_22570 [Syntrophobacteraceae bacterium]|jgi:hypothetical protein
MEYTSCQIQNLNKNLWLQFRKLCLAEGVSASAKIRAMVEEVVAATDMASLEKGKDNER